MRELKAKESLNANKHLLLLINLKPWFSEKYKFKLFSVKKIFIQKIFVMLKTCVFCFEIRVKPVYNDH